MSVRDARAVLSAPDLAEAAQLANQLRAAHATNGAKEDRERHGPLANLWAEVPAVLATFDHDRAAGHCSPALLGNLRLLVDQLLPTAAPPAEPEPVSAEVNAAAVSGGPLDDPAGVAATEPSEPEPADMPPEVAELRRRLESGELDRWAGGPIRLDRAHSISPGLLSRAAERRLIGWERAVTPKARAAAAELCHELVEALDASTPAEIGGGA